jgi:flagellar biosynthesis/type III secretory pathway chaperone
MVVIGNLESTGMWVKLQDISAKQTKYLQQLNRTLLTEICSIHRRSKDVDIENFTKAKVIEGHFEKLEHAEEKGLEERKRKCGEGTNRFGV